MKLEKKTSPTFPNHTSQSFDIWKNHPTRVKIRALPIARIPLGLTDLLPRAANRRVPRLFPVRGQARRRGRHEHGRRGYQPAGAPHARAPDPHVELLRKKVESMWVPEAGTMTGYSTMAVHAVQIVWLWSLVFSCIQDDGTRAVFGIFWAVAAAKNPRWCRGSSSLRSSAAPSLLAGTRTSSAPTRS